MVSTVLAQNPSEYQIKAAYLLNFLRFVEWPATAFETPTSAISICILGEDPFGLDIDQLVKGESVGNRKVTIDRLRRPPVPKSCHVLFVTKTEQGVPAVLSSLGPGILTVSDREAFLREDGMIALVIDDRRVRFDVNQGVATRASLRMSARMLNVARTVVK